MSEFFSGGKTVALYKLPIWERSVNISHSIWLRKEVVMRRRDGVGVIVIYSNSGELDLEELERHHPTRRKNYCLVEADSFDDMLREFYEEFEGANLSGTIPQENAIWIDTSELILKYPDCERRYQNQDGGYVCCHGEEYINDAPGCILSNFDPAEDCPVSEFCHRLFQLERLKDLLPVKQVGPYRLVEAEDIISIEH